MGTAGDTGHDSRLFVTAVGWRSCTEVPWRDLPERFGKWNSVARRFRRWAQAGAWHTISTAVQEPDWEGVLVDSTTVRAPAAAAGQKKFGPARMPRQMPGRFHDQLRPRISFGALNWA